MLLGFAGLGACGGGGDGGSSQSASEPPPPAATVGLRLINAGWTEAPLDVLVDGKTVATNLDFGQAVQLSVAAGSHQVRAYWDVPGGSNSSVYGPADVSFDANTSYAVALEDASPGEMSLDVLPQPSGAVPAQLGAQ